MCLQGWQERTGLLAGQGVGHAHERGAFRGHAGAGQVLQAVRLRHRQQHPPHPNHMRVVRQVLRVMRHRGHAARHRLRRLHADGTFVMRD